MLAFGCITFTGDNGLCTIATFPFRPNQWKNHPVRTGIVAAVYVGGAAAAALDGGSGESSVEPASIEPTPTPRNSGHNHDDSGHNGTL